MIYDPPIVSHSAQDLRRFAAAILLPRALDFASRSSLVGNLVVLCMPPYLRGGKPFSGIGFFASFARLRSNSDPRYRLPARCEPAERGRPRRRPAWFCRRLRPDRDRLSVPVFALSADLLAQPVVHPVDSAVGGPGLEVVVDQLVVREVRGQRVPLATGPVEITDRVQNVAARVDDWTSATGAGRHVRAEDRPLGVAGVRRVVPRPAGRQVISEGGRGR